MSLIRICISGFAYKITIIISVCVCVVEFTKVSLFTKTRINVVIKAFWSRILIARKILKDKDICMKSKIGIFLYI